MLTHKITISKAKIQFFFLTTLHYLDFFSKKRVFFQKENKYDIKINKSYYKNCLISKKLLFDMHISLRERNFNLVFI